jgi:ribosome-binding factor A
LTSPPSSCNNERSGWRDDSGPSFLPGFPLDYKRADRVAESIKREVSVLILQEVKDPAVQGVTVTDVELTDDLRHARVFVSILGDEVERKRTLAGLDRAKGFLRSAVAKVLGLRYAPELRFHLDTSIDRAMRIEEVLRKIREKEGGSPAAESSPEDPEAGT